MRSLNAHMNDILNDYDTMKYDIMCLQETYMTLCMKNKKFSNHTFISSYITHGVMILVKKHITLLDHMHFEEKYVEMVLARVILSGLQIAIFDLYAVPRPTLQT
jgi:exonuclease III